MQTTTTTTHDTADLIRRDLAATARRACWGGRSIARVILTARDPGAWHDVAEDLAGQRRPSSFHDLRAMSAACDAMGRGDAGGAVAILAAAAGITSAAWIDATIMEVGRGEL